MSKSMRNGSVINFEALEDGLYQRLNKVKLNKHDAFFMINLHPHPEDKCFLTNEDIKIKKRDSMESLYYQKQFCQLLCGVAQTLFEDGIKMKLQFEKHINHIKQEISSILTGYETMLKKIIVPDFRPLNFFHKFQENVYIHDNDLLNALEKIIRKWETYTKPLNLDKAQKELSDFKTTFQRVKKNFEHQLYTLWPEPEPIKILVVDTVDEMNLRELSIDLTPPLANSDNKQTKQEKNLKSSVLSTRSMNETINTTFYERAKTIFLEDDEADLHLIHKWRMLKQNLPRFQSLIKIFN